MKQYESKYSDLKFFGAVPNEFDDQAFLGIKNTNFNELLESGKKRIGYVFNLDEHWKSGSHWVAMYCDLDKNQIYYFDSYGKRPDKRIRTLAKRIGHHAEIYPTLEYFPDRPTEVKNAYCSSYKIRKEFNN